MPADVALQLEHELALIEELDFAGYFLTVWDIVRFARSRKILCQGRGSAANSVVCYVLGITAIDPVRMNLLFERFVSVERGEPPDIDVDFEHERREEVLQYVYDKYGRDHAAMVCEVICYRGRSAVREVGKAVGLSLEQVGRLSKVVPRGRLGDIGRESILEAGLDPSEKAVCQALAVATQIEGFPRHLGIHTGGFVITRDPLSHLVPVENAAMAGRTVIQWDKDDIDSLGILKVDLLGLGMLTCLRKGFDLVREHEGRELSLETIPPEDPAVYDAICRADTLGMFQIESRAQMSMLPRLRPRHFYDLVVEVALVRPGPIQGDMVHPYLRRRQGLEKVDFPHPAVKRILGRTYGIPLFQEQVMRLAIAAGGFTPGEADGLRRAMKAWRRQGQMKALAERLIQGLIQNGIEPRYAQRIFEQIQGFGEYGFPESHAASFALLVYASGYLRVHHFAAFTAALLNSQPMGFYSPSSIVQDALRHDLTILPVEIGKSDWDCTLERLPAEEGRDGPSPLALRLGFCIVRGLGEAAARHLIDLRESSETLKVLGDWMRRGRLRKDQWLRLASAGAFHASGITRREALWQIQGMPPMEFALLAPVSIPEEPEVLLPVATDREEMLADYAAMGLSVDYHPIALVRDTLERRGMPSAKGLSHLRHGAWVTIAGMVITRQRPGTAKGVLFLTLEDETGHMNVVVWQKVYDRYRSLARDEVLLEVEGRVQREGRVIHVVAKQLRPLSLAACPPTTSVRSFR